MKSAKIYINIIQKSKKKNNDFLSTKNFWYLNFTPSKNPSQYNFKIKIKKKKEN